MNDRGLLNKSLADLKSARLVLEDNDELLIPIGAYHLQQAIEKLLKFKINLKGKRYPPTHNLQKLLDDCDLYSIGYPDWIKENISTLNEWATRTRYDDSLDISLTTVQNILSKTEELFREVENTIGEEKEEKTHPLRRIF